MNRVERKQDAMKTLRGESRVRGAGRIVEIGAVRGEARELGFTCSLTGQGRILLPWSDFYRLANGI